MGNSRLCRGTLEDAEDDLYTRCMCGDPKEAVELGLIRGVSLGTHRRHSPARHLKKIEEVKVKSSHKCNWGHEKLKRPKKGNVILWLVGEMEYRSLWKVLIDEVVARSYTGKSQDYGAIKNVLSCLEL